VDVDALSLDDLDRQALCAFGSGNRVTPWPAHAPGERQLVRELGARLLGRFLRPAAAREQVIAGSLGCPEPGLAPNFPCRLGDRRRSSAGVGEATGQTTVSQARGTYRESGQDEVDAGARASVVLCRSPLDGSQVARSRQA
jgi:hypothetical protein